ncbi:MAG: NUDIX domain-containing protein [Candidatus Pacearchaeota archaeon]
MKYRRGIFIVTYTKEKKIKYLILKRKLHWIGWEFPKGGKKSSESYKKSVKREIFEETGQRLLRIINLNVNGKYKYPKKIEDRPGIIGQTYKLYAVEIKRNKIKIDKLEHSNYMWVDFKDALRKLTWKDQRKCLKIVNSYLIYGKKK